jgi:hypothetical protein
MSYFNKTGFGGNDRIVNKYSVLDNAELTHILSCLRSMHDRLILAVRHAV